MKGFAVELLDVFWFPGNVEGIGSRRRHPKGQLKRLDNTFHLGIGFDAIQEPLVHALEKIEPLTLNLQVGGRIAEVADRRIAIVARDAQRRPLVNRWQE